MKPNKLPRVRVVHQPHSSPCKVGMVGFAYAMLREAHEGPPEELGRITFTPGDLLIDCAIDGIDQKQLLPRDCVEFLDNGDRKISCQPIKN